jgi:hypothetical protein
MRSVDVPAALTWMSQCILKCSQEDKLRCEWRIGAHTVPTCVLREILIWNLFKMHPAIIIIVIGLETLIDFRLLPRCWWDLRGGLTRCPETSVNNYHTTPRNIPRERRSHVTSIFTVSSNISSVILMVYIFPFTLLWYRSSWRWDRQCTYNGNSEARSHNHCWHGKAINYIFCVCVCSLSYPAYKAHAP